jgi:DNA-binding IclR family transcriptional regulator
MEKASNGTSARRALRVLKLLKGHALEGLANAEIAKGTGESAVNVSRALDVLVAEGLVTRLDSGRYAHSVMMLQMAEAFARETELAGSRITELKQRVAAGAQR